MIRVQDHVVRYLDQAILMQVATCKGEQPWCATVYFAHDNRNNLYWVSMSDARHSQEISKNAKVAGAIVLPHNYGGVVRGLQFQGTAKALIDDDDIRKYSAAYSERFGRASLADDIISGKNPYYLYQIKPEQFVLFDTLHFPEEPRQIWHVGRD